MLILLPIVILIGDYTSFPSLFENRMLTNRVSVTSILNHQVVLFGTIKGHDISIAIDRISNEKYLSYVKGDSNALVISHYVYEKSEGAAMGALGQAVLSKLMQISPDDGRRFRDLVDQFEGLSPGSILELDLHVPQDQYDRFPIKHLFVLLIEHGDVRMSEGIFSQGISNVFNKAVERNVSSLIIPCLGYSWQNKHSISFDGCFGPVLQSLPSSPSNIYLSLYSDWPTFALEQATASLNRVWENSYRQAKYGNLQIPYRGELRSTLILLSICLLVSSFSVYLTFKNFFIISITFIGLKIGSGSFIDFVSQDHSVSFRFYIQTFILFIIAVGLPIFAHWNPQDIFDKRRC